MPAFGLAVAFVVMRYPVRTPFLSPDTMPQEIQIRGKLMLIASASVCEG
jgi:hypothetical protein